MRYKAVLEYEGTNFCGWQHQEGSPSVQDVVESALMRFTGVATPVVAAGRTDAGVHALGQVIHFDIAHNRYDHKTVLRALNYYLDDAPVSVVAVVCVGDDFHARFSATLRVYQYKIVNRQARLAIDTSRAWWFKYSLNLELMLAEAQDCLGNHDFSSFRDSKCQAKNPIRTLDAFTLTKEGDDLLVEVRARSFLHRQVRIMVGTLVGIGSGLQKQSMRQILDQKARKSAGVTAPAHGLYLKSVFYGP